ncbi:acyltransferase [Stenotrophomonas rhizophila]|uniref:acyltransferase family protein n=1 Tax=Stenotrophomonas rhizophila TaxID=216778 RepID=UPI000B89102B|nr:acyltransferase [Stenotrophomonas rhizophila]
MSSNIDAARERGAKILSLEGLRGLAAVAVVLSHLGMEFFPTAVVGTLRESHVPAEQWLYDSPFRGFYAGFFAVCIFFVLSGYVLSLKYLRTLDTRVISDALAKRYFRLAPAVIASTLLMAITAGLLNGMALAQWPSHLLSAAREGVYGSFLFGDNAHNGVTWTMQVELLGSLILFVYLLAFGRLRWGWIAGAVLCAALMARLPLMGCFFTMFLCGAYLGRVAHLASHPVVAALMLALGFYLGGYDSPSASYRQVVVWANTLQFEYGIALNWPVVIPGLGAVLMVWSLLGGSLISRPFASRPCAWLGKISFALYLTHTLVIMVVCKPLLHLAEPHIGYVGAAIIASFIVLILSMVVASVFYRLFDKPSVQWANAIGRHAVEGAARAPARSGEASPIQAATS